MTLYEKQQAERREREIEGLKMRFNWTAARVEFADKTIEKISRYKTDAKGDELNKLEELIAECENTKAKYLEKVERAEKLSTDGIDELDVYQISQINLDLDLASSDIMLCYTRSIDWDEKYSEEAVLTKLKQISESLNSSPKTREAQKEAKKLLAKFGQ